VPPLLVVLTCPLKAEAEEAKAKRKAIDFIIVVERVVVGGGGCVCTGK